MTTHFNSHGNYRRVKCLIIYVSRSHLSSIEPRHKRIVCLGKRFETAFALRKDVSASLPKSFIKGKR